MRYTQSFTLGSVQELAQPGLYALEADNIPRDGDNGVPWGEELVAEERDGVVVEAVGLIAVEVALGGVWLGV